MSATVRTAGLLTGLFLVSLGSGCSGCEPRVDHFRICTLSPQRDGPVNATQIRIRQGAVVALKLMPFDKKGKIMEDVTVVSAYAGPAGILGVRKLQYETEACPGPAEAPWYFVIHGIAPGETTLTLYADGSEGVAIPVTVTSP